MSPLKSDYDVLIIGGGINGAGIARDAAGRGLQVVLCERGDLGGATSMASSKLVHGGLRYLEQGRFRLVRESLAEREVLLRVAPHLVRPLRFVLPHVRGLRPAWLIRAGLWCYDRLGGATSLWPSAGVDLREAPFAGDLKPEFRSGFAYSDCRVDDARLVVTNALSAQKLGATVLPRTECVALAAAGGRWRAELQSGDGRRQQISVRAIVNAAGPWVGQVLRDTAGIDTAARVRLVQGSHIIVPRRIAGDHAYILQNHDRRIVFALPFERKFTLIGTTEVILNRPPDQAGISAWETGYLCDAVNRYLAKTVRPEDVVWSYAGVRALHDDGSANPSEVTRDYFLQLDHAGDGAPILSVLGGKITTYRRLAEEVIDKLAAVLGIARGRWTADAPLPGAATGHFDYPAFMKSMITRHAALPTGLVEGIVRRHGSAAVEVLGDAEQVGDLGTHFGAGLTAREVDYFIDTEWARSGEDVLWRRSKTGLHMSPAERVTVSDYVRQRVGV